MKTGNRRIGLYGGTFDPIHIGHLHLALSLYERHNLQEVWFLPTQMNPIKASSPVSFGHRVAMLRLALEKLPQFSVNEIEQALPAPSYTIQTVRALKEQHPDKEFAFLLGEDAAASLPKWKEPHALIEQVPLLIGARSHHEPPQIPDDQALEQAVHQGWTSLSLFDLSATELRHRLNQGLYCGHLIPGKVVDYISKNELY